MQAHVAAKAMENFIGMEIFGVSVNSDRYDRIEEIKIEFIGKDSKSGTMTFSATQITPHFEMSREYQAKVF